MESSSPKATTLPASGLTKPLSTLKKVVLPAPFGPMRPHVPASNVTVMRSIGTTPPNRTVRSSTVITHVLGLLAPTGQFAGQAAEVLGHLFDDAAGGGEQHLDDPMPKRMVRIPC